MSDQKVFEQPLVFGLDIGTRNVVGTVGYRREKEFVVVAQQIVEHDTRAMLDGQIHDIGRVSRAIQKVREELEEQCGQPLKEVCIAAAGRVLKTVTVNIEQEFSEETVVTGEDIHTLDLMGIEKAQGILKKMNDTNYKFYCVGYSVVKYYLNDELFSSLESHKADKISEDLIVTFLPEDVVDGLYAAVAQAGLSVTNLTLEPIAAINVAIPENFRLLNIALVDIGAGTSDISVTKDGSIIAYGMIPLAGDEITELIVQHYLVDFKTAEFIKLQSGTEDEITYKDIMMIEHTVPSAEVWELTEPVVDKMTTEVAEKIKELNGNQTVSATFVVGGGGKIHGYTEMLAEKLELPKERVALRGEEVLQEVVFEQKEIKKDPLLVTPVGICLNYYDQRNSFIMVRFNGERIKLYDNNKLTIVDAAIQAGFPNEDLFPKRGKELQFTVDGVTRVVRGEPGDSAAIYMNERLVGINTPLEPNSEIIIEPSTKGAPASSALEELEEYTSVSVLFVVNGRIIRCPKFLEVNGSLELPSYQIREGDQIETRSFYTVGQLAEFMDVEVDLDREILVNNRTATLETLIYENFSIDWTVLSYGVADFLPENLEVADLPFLKDSSSSAAGHAAASIGASIEKEKTDMEDTGNGNGAGNTWNVSSLNKMNPEGESVELSDIPPAEISVEEQPDGEPGRSFAGNAGTESGNSGQDGQPAETEDIGSAETAGRQPGAANAADTAAHAGETQTAERAERTAESGLDGTEERTAYAGNIKHAGDSGTDETREHSVYAGTAAQSGKSGLTGTAETEKQEIESGLTETAEAEKQEVESGLTGTAEAEKDAGKSGFTEAADEKQKAAGSAVSTGIADETDGITIYINSQPVRLTGKPHYIFVDLFDFYEFDLSAAAGRSIVTNINGRRAQFSGALNAGDQIELGWKE